MRTFIIGAAAAALIACGGRVGDVEHGLEGPTAGEQAADYPKGDYGYELGKIVPNVAFRGYEHLDPATTIDTKSEAIGTVRISDYYDPAGERGLSFLVVTVQVFWCGPSNQQDDATNSSGGFATEYAPSGVRFMTLLQQGPTFGIDATDQDLDKWIDLHKARTSQALISGAEMTLDVVGPAWPYNMIVDLRTMRIVATWLGFDYNNDELNALIRARVRRMADH
jgi:hypothetical protein